MIRGRGNPLGRVLVASMILAAASPVLADGDSKLEVHGFLTQAWATADFATGPAADLSGGVNFDERLIGISEDGTFDYRNLALQFRYDISDNDTMIIQLSNEATGISPVDDLRDEVELDWAFYERKLGSDSRLRVGRVQIPWGIYNEIRDVGTILPFYRPAYAIYLEGGFTSETVDGLGFSHVFSGNSDWSLDLELYAGEYEAFEISQMTGASARVKARDVFGAQLWLNTPISGLRLGAAIQSKSLEEGLEGFLRPVGGSNDYTDYMFSVDGDFDRWSARAEYRAFEPDNLPSFIGSPNLATLDLSAYYFQLGFGITDALRIYAQYENQDFEQTSADFATGRVEYTQREDVGVALNYRFGPQLLLKAEYHETEYQAPAIFPIFQPNAPPLLGAEILDADGGNYGILALSVSF